MGICCMTQRIHTGSVTTWKGGMGWEVGGRFQRERIYVYLLLIHVDVWQKPAQYYKAIILRLKIHWKKGKNRKLNIIILTVLFQHWVTLRIVSHRFWWYICFYNHQCFFINILLQYLCGKFEHIIIHFFVLWWVFEVIAGIYRCFIF